jgi:hypothetical protein
MNCRLTATRQTCVLHWKVFAEIAATAAQQEALLLASVARYKAASLRLASHAAQSVGPGASVPW